MARPAVLRPSEVDFAGRFVDTQHLFAARCFRICGAEELAVAIVSLYNHASHGVVRATVLHSWHVDLANLGFVTGHDHVLLERLPRHRDRVTFDILARPRIHKRGKKNAATLRCFGASTHGIILRVVALPCVAHGVFGTSLRVLPDLIFRQVRCKHKAPLTPPSGNLNVFIGLVGNQPITVEKDLANVHRRQRTRIQKRGEATRVSKTPISERAVLRVIEGKTQSPSGFRRASRSRL